MLEISQKEVEILPMTPVLDERLEKTLTAFLHSHGSELTSREYARAGREFLSFAFQDIHAISELGRDHLILYQKWLKSKGQAHKTILKKMSAVSSLCKHLAHEGFIERDLSYGLKRPRSDNKRETADFSDDEVRRLFSAQWLFPSLSPIRNSPISSMALEKILKRLVKKADIKPSSVRRYSPHSMRATLAGHLLNVVEAPLDQVQRTLGHASPATTINYNKREQDHDKNPVYRIEY